MGFTQNRISQTEANILMSKSMLNIQRIPGPRSGLDWYVALCPQVSPRLTTVHQPLRQMGVEAAKLVLSAARGEDAPGSARMDLATSLVVRDSTAPPRA